MLKSKGVLNLRISKDQTRDNHKEWKLKDINIGNKLHKINNTLRSGGGERSIVDRGLDAIPHLKVYEFQPESFRGLEQYIEVVKKQVMRTLDHLMLLGNGLISNFPKVRAIVKSLLNGDELLDAVTKSGANKTEIKKAVNASKKLLRDMLVTESGYTRDVFEAPIKEYNSFFNGKYIRSYEMPYNSETYLYADGQSGWKTLNTNSINLGNKALNNIFKGIANLGITDIPLIPNWVNKNDSSNYYKISTKFHLVNNNINTLISNFVYLSQLMQGSMWMRYDTHYVPPNIYSVELPGFLFIRFAALNISVKSLGNKRFLDSVRLKEIYKISGYEMFKDGKTDEDIFFPDAWELELTFVSLVPNNYNTFMNYLQHGCEQRDRCYGGFNNNIIVGSSIGSGEDKLSYIGDYNNDNNFGVVS